MAVRENAPVAPTDLPAPGEAAAVPQAGTAAVPICPDTAEWLLRYFHEHAPLGVKPPADLEKAVRILLSLDQPSFAHASENSTSGIVELSTAQIARRMGCSAQWVRHLCQVGKLRARRAGRDWLITVEEEHQDEHERRHTG